jgi:hypothetical protein
VSHVSSIVQLTSSPQSSSIVDIAPQDTQDPTAASPLSHTKPRAHALTRKSYVANQNNICPKPPKEDIANSSIACMARLYHADAGSHPMFHCRIA